MYSLFWRRTRYFFTHRHHPQKGGGKLTTDDAGFRITHDQIHPHILVILQEPISNFYFLTVQHSTRQYVHNYIHRYEYRMGSNVLTPTFCIPRAYRVLILQKTLKYAPLLIKST